jgi:hypothetical protein
MCYGYRKEVRKPPQDGVTVKANQLYRAFQNVGKGLSREQHIVLSWPPTTRSSTSLVG